MTKIKISIIIGSICLIAVFGSCQNNNNKSSPSKDDLLEIKTATFKSSTGWGYKVYVGDEIYINQPFIPDVQGKHYFKTEEDAQKVATLVVEKIKQHHFPPTISAGELQQLHIDIE